MRLSEIQSVKAQSPEQQRVAKIAEIEEGTKTLSASELRVKSLADKAMKLKDEKKQEIARQSLAKAQQRMAKANNPKHASF
jgi:hypothetical protein